MAGHAARGRGQVNTQDSGISAFNGMRLRRRVQACSRSLMANRRRFVARFANLCARSPSPLPGSRGVLEQQDQEIKQEIKQSNRLPNKFENGASTRAGGARTREQAAPLALQQTGQCGQLAGAQPQGALYHVSAEQPRLQRVLSSRPRAGQMKGLAPAPAWVTESS